MDDKQLIEDLLSALEYHTEQTRPIEFSNVAIQAAREYLRKPPQRQWVGLEAEDRLCAKYMQDAPDGIEAVIDYIEAKLKEKNT